MSNKKHVTDRNLLSSLRQKGLIIPTKEEDIDAFEKAIKEHNIPPLPAKLNDPDSILKSTYSQRPVKLVTNHDENFADLARAAREGKAIPQSVLDKMKKDRDDAEKEK